MIFPESLFGAIIIKSRTPSFDISRTINSTLFVGINAIVITPSPTAAASDVNDIAGIVSGFDVRKFCALDENSGPMIMSGLVANAVFIASVGLVDVS